MSADCCGRERVEGTITKYDQAAVSRRSVVAAA
jgi:hypothetical protein